MTDCFLCPTDENYAAVSLQLQQTAQQAEECLYSLEHDLRAAANLPSVVYTSTSTESVLANVNDQIAQATSTVTFANIAIPNNFAFPIIPLGAGMWHIGAAFNCIATGAVTLDSYRILEIRSRKLTDLSLGESTNSVQSTQYEPNNGTGVDITFSTVFPLTDTDVVQFRFLHNNASSVNISIGARWWMTRLSDQFNARVVA